MNSDPDLLARMAAWQEHLRQGGTTTWSRFSGPVTPTGERLDEGAGGRPSEGSDERLREWPSAVHLELVRRLDGSLPDFAGLADLVWATPAPGRGRVDVPLPGGGPAPFGAPPMEPELLPAAELLRVAVGVLDRLVGDPVVTTPGAPGRGMLPRRHFQVSGTPVACKLARSGLLRAGWREHPRRARHFVFGAPLPDAVAQLWSDRVAGGAATSWPDLWRRLASSAELPGRLRFDELVQAAGKHAVPVYGTLDEVAAQLNRRYRVKLDPAPGMDLVATALRRRLNATLATRMTWDRRRAAGPVITEVIGQSRTPVTRLSVPPAERHWASAHGSRPADYPQGPALDAPVVVADERVLQLGIDAIGRGWVRARLEEGSH